MPYYEGFRGTVTAVADDDKRFLIQGVYEMVSPTVVKITELPVGTWTMPYMTYLEGLVDGGTDKQGKKIPPALKEVVSHSTEKMSICKQCILHAKTA